jgi:DNA-damage-inducible protein J
MLHVRVDETIKKEATETLERMGLSVSDAVRLFLRRVVADRAIPFDIKAPNAATREAMAEAEEILQTRRSRFADADALLADLEKAGDA